MITQNKLDLLNLEIIKEYDNKQISLDGILNLEKYNTSNPKILWILKEPNWGNDHYGYIPEKENLTIDEMQEFLQEQKQSILDYYSNVAKGYPKWRTTFKNISYIVYGILNNIYTWDEIPDIDNNANVGNDYYVDKIALINIKKSGGGSSANYKEIASQYEKHTALLHKQIEFCNPDIIINSSRNYSVFEALLNGVDIQNKNGIDFGVSNNRLIINTYHPALRSSHKKYVDFNLAIVKDFIQK